MRSAVDLDRANPPPVVVQFKPSGDPGKALERRIAQRRRVHPDRKLIVACVDFAALVSGSEACFCVDPTDSEFAAVTDDLARSRARRELATATKCKAQTMDGLQAKAALIPMICKAGEFADPINDDERQFLLSIAADVKRFHRGAHFSSRDRMPEPPRDHLQPTSEARV